MAASDDIIGLLITIGDAAAAAAVLTAAAVLLVGVLWSCVVGSRAVRRLEEGTR